MNTLKTLLLSSAVCLGLASASVAADYRVSTWLPAGETSTESLIWFANALKEATNGEISFQVFPSGALVPARAQMKGVSDGVVHMASHTSLFTPSELPIANSLDSIGFIEPDPMIMGAAWADFMMHDQAQNDEFRQHGVVPVGGFSTPNNGLICNTSQPITTRDQFRGLKVRAISPMKGLVQYLGAVPVDMPATEVYQGLQAGQIDCAALFLAYLNLDNKLDEVSKSSTLVRWTGNYNSPLHLYNKAFWQSLTDEQRGKIFELAARAQAKSQVRYETSQQKSLDTATAKGHVVAEPGDDLKAAIAEWVANGVGDMAGKAKTTLGIADPDALFSSFQVYVEKWQGIIGNMKNRLDEDELAGLIYENIYKDIDPSKYGMN